MANPTESHITGIKRVMRYLNGTRNRGIRYSKSHGLDLRGYSDSDYAGDRDKAKSTTGWVFFMAGGPVSWSSHRQSVVAQSTAEAEYYALNSATREAAWLRSFLTELDDHVNGPIPSEWTTMRPSVSRRTLT